MGLVRIALAVAALAAITACSGPVTAVPASYYLALGDSLSQGVQPDRAGANVETRQGYPDQLYAALRSGHPGLRLVTFGCPGETTGTMINGGICGYPGGSQLAAAAAFLRAHRGRVFLITIDIGANDPEDCGSWASLSTIARVADVSGAFDTADFGDQVTVPGIGQVPRNVALVCQWTWACVAPPRGPDQHANQAGYGVIARAFLQAAGLS